MAKPIVVITRPIPEPAHHLLSKKYIVRSNKVNKVLHKKALLRHVAGASAILSVIPDQITSDVLDAAGQQLKIVANFAVGFDNIDVEAAKARNIIVTNTPGVLTEAVAEHTLALMFACARRISEADTFMRAGRYKQWEPLGFLGPQLWGKTIGVVGLGRIGSWVAEIAHTGLGMEVIYYDLERNDELEMRTGAIYHELPTLLARADVVSIHLPLLPSTRHFIGAPELRLMKKTAILINTSRGPIIDEAALVTALKRQQIWAAGLDVFEHEPKLTTGLRELPNVVLTPHTASATIEARHAMSKIAANNILAVLTGRAPLNPV